MATDQQVIYMAARKLKALVALDDGGQRIVMKAQLCRDGHDVDLCVNGEKAWKMIQTSEGDTWSYDIIFLEYNLKDRGACAITIDVRAEEDKRRVKAIQAGHEDDSDGFQKRLFIVGVTPKDDPSTREECLTAGMDTVISKPMERRMIRDIVDHALEYISPVSDIAPLSISRTTSPGHSPVRSLAALKASSGGSTPLENSSPHLGVAGLVGSQKFVRTKSGGSRHVRVLVVDDDGGQRILMKSALVREGFEVETAEHGAKAIEILNQRRFDVVLMDGMMPNMTGWEATKKIRDQEKFENKLPMIIVGVINAAMPQEETKCLESGMTTTFSKPVERARLMTYITTWIQVIA